mgnify:CR=1 FL=1
MMMKHKRIAALLLALIAAFCLTGAANAADESPVVWEGTLTEVLEDGFVMQEADGREILFNVDEQTSLDGFETLEDLDVGMYVIVESDGRLTKSIPPQAHADRVTCYWLAGQVESVDAEENTFLMQTELGEVIVHQGDLTTPVYAGMTVTVYFDGVMAMSLPGQIAARKIVVPELQGTVLEMTENGFVLRTDDEMEYDVSLTDETVFGVLLSADEVAENESEEAEVSEENEEEISGEDKEEETASAEDEAENEPAETADEQDGSAESATRPAMGDRVTVYFSGEYTDEDGHELTALEVLTEKAGE